MDVRSHSFFILVYNRIILFLLPAVNLPASTKFCQQTQQSHLPSRRVLCLYCALHLDPSLNDLLAEHIDIQRSCLLDQEHQFFCGRIPVDGIHIIIKKYERSGGFPPLRIVHTCNT